LKTTQRNLIGCMAVAMSLSAGFAHAGLQEHVAAAFLTSAAVGQQPGSGSIFSGFSSNQPAAPNEPFAARNVSAAAAAVPSANGVTRLPPTGINPPSDDDRYPVAGAAPPQGMAPGASNVIQNGYFTQDSRNSMQQTGGQNLPPRGNRVHSDAMLRQARLALAVGDIRRASDMAAQSRQDQIRYAPNEDSPDRVAAAIAKYVEISKLDRGSEENRRTYARMWMEQAQDLLQWNELDQAEKLVEMAAQQRVTFGPFDAKPDDLLRRISAMREQNRPMGPPSANISNSNSVVGPTPAARQQAMTLMRNIRSSLAIGQIAQAEFMCRQLDAMRIPERSFGPGEDTPGRVFEAVHQAQRRFASGGVMQAGGTVDVGAGVNNAVYDPSRDRTRNMQVADISTDPVPAPPDQPSGPTISPDASNQSPGYALFQQGEAALKNRDRDRALQLFRQASAYSSQLDPVTAERLQDHLSLLSAPRNAAQHPGAPGQPGAPLDDAAAARQALVSQVFSDMTRRESEAKAMREKDPKGALALLQETRKKVETSAVEPGIRDRWLRQIDRSIEETQQFIAANRSRIELNEKNGNVRAEMNREALNKEQVQRKLAEMVDQFNHLSQDQRYEEARVVAEQAHELAPHELVTSVMVTESKLRLNYFREMQIKDQRDENTARELIDITKASDPGNGEPINFPDAKSWHELSGRRARAAADHARHHRSQQEIEIEKKLQTPVNYSCHNRPLNEVLNQLAKLVNINIHIDEEGLREEGKSVDMPVTQELNCDIMLKSYLNLLLQQHHLCYIIKHEVLNITSESKKTESSQIYQVVYPVGDLVMPIPNFVASPRMGLQGALHDAMSNAVGASGTFGAMGSPMPALASNPTHGTSINPAVMANAARVPVGNNAAAGPGGAGGGAAADFDTLIDLITQTVAPPTWDHNGGKGSVAPSPANLSLVISQTQEVHEEIVDLLEQLRRMQDLQVTIEVRFITLNDDFFERIGVDFDFTIAKNISNPQANGFSAPQTVTVGGQNFTAPTYTPGLSNGISVSGIQGGSNNPAQTGIFTADNSISFQQGNFALGVPQFGGFDAAAGATVGFAILSDIEAFFFINAAAGDRRTNVLQAPKVTLFNGQQAFVSDTSQTPFVISVIPVVGDFAAAQQPVIVVLSEGTFMTVQAVVSNDRRFVRLTIVPFFSKIGNVQTFTFQGSQTTTSNTTRNGIVNTATGNLFNNNNDQTSTTTNGVTVQLPTFSFVTVTTTVSVPDGGTVLLGGIKRLSEGRNEFGVPILDEIPYLNRLFKNVGIGRETSSLMMMVTPRIIIQEEEEDKLGIGAGAP
jgi:general secretion pathway protein D